MSVFLMRKRYQYSLMFVENYYDFTYIHQQSIKLDMKQKKLSRHMQNIMVLALNIIIMTMEFLECMMDEPLLGYSPGP